MLPGRDGAITLTEGQMIRRASAAAAGARRGRVRVAGCRLSRRVPAGRGVPPQPPRRQPRPPAAHTAERFPSSETASSATWVGVRPTRTPRRSSASALARAVPCEPETIAPAWPIVLPGGAVKPAM